MSMTDPLGRDVEYACDAPGRLTAVTIARGNITQYEYDEHGRRTAEVAPDGRRREYPVCQPILDSQFILLCQ